MIPGKYMDKSRKDLEIGNVELPRKCRTQGQGKLEMDGCGISHYVEGKEKRMGPWKVTKIWKQKAEFFQEERLGKIRVEWGIKKSVILH